MPPAGGDANLGPSATSASSDVCMLSPPAQRVPDSQVVGQPPVAVGISGDRADQTERTERMEIDSAPRTPL
eukprot:6524817-Lingulodinium_polyedra.AAC.1